MDSAAHHAQDFQDTDAAVTRPLPASEPEESPWRREASFSTQLSFALQQPEGGDRLAAPLRAPVGLGQARRIAGTYTVSYNAASGLLALSGILNVDGSTYFVDDQLMLDQAASYDGFVQGDRLVAWSVSGLPEQGPGLKLLAGLAVMAHLGLRPQRGEPPDQPRNAASTSSSIFFASPNSMRLLSL